MIRPQTSWPTVPVVDATHFQAPTQGTALQAFAQAANYLAAWRFLRAEHTEIEWDVSGLIRPDVERLSPIGVAQTVKLTWRTHEKAKYVFVEFAYQSGRASAAGSNTVDAGLRLAFGGAVQDAGCRWDQDRGDLSADAYIVESGGTQADAYRLLLANTGASVIDAPAAFPTAPRMLNVGTNTNTDVEVRLVTNGARIHAVTVWEAFVDEVTP